MERLFASQSLLLLVFEYKLGHRVPLLLAEGSNNDRGFLFAIKRRHVGHNRSLGEFLYITLVQKCGRICKQIKPLNTARALLGARPRHRRCYIGGAEPGVGGRRFPLLFGFVATKHNVRCYHLLNTRPPILMN